MVGLAVDSDRVQSAVAEQSDHGGQVHLLDEPSGRVMAGAVRVNLLDASPSPQLRQQVTDPPIGVGLELRNVTTRAK